MVEELPPIFFFNPDINWDYKDMPESAGKYIKAKPGHYVWTVKTCGFLRKAGFPCKLTRTLPNEGIILAHRDHLKNNLRPNQKQLIICIVADTQRHPFSQVHLVQNPQDEMVRKQSKLWKSYFMPHWPESGLIPRDPERKDKFENVTYFGQPRRLAPQLLKQKWDKELKKLGFKWRIATPSSWNDYSDTDVIIAVRSFTGKRFYDTPASKLYNSWIARTPAILGPESAYQSERKSELDYIEVKSPKDILLALQELRNNKELRLSIIENCELRASEILPDQIVKKWFKFFIDEAFPYYNSWCNMEILQQQVFFQKRICSFKLYKFRMFVHRVVWYLIGIGQLINLNLRKEL